MLRHVTLCTAALAMCLLPIVGSAQDAPAPTAAPQPRIPMSDWLKNVPDTLATVDGEPLTSKELYQAIAMTYARAQANMPPGNRMPTMSPTDEYSVFEMLLESRALRHMVDAAKIKADPERLDELVAQDIERAGGQEAFDARMKQAGVTPEAHRKLREDQLKQEIYNENLVKDITVTDEEVKAEYDRLVAAGQMERPARADIRHILVRFKVDDDASKKEAKERIEAIRKRVADGKEDFATVASEVSEDQNTVNQGGFMAVVKNTMRTPFEQNAFTLEPGVVSEPFESSAGWHIMTVLKRYDADQVAFDQVAEPIRENLLNTKRGAVLREKVQTAMKNDLKVDILVEKPAEPAPSQDVNSAFDTLLDQSS